MRVQILAFSVLAMASQAFAGSIDEIKTGGATRSIERITCAHCVTVVAPKKAATPELAPGTQRVEIRDVNGVMTIFRTEAWMGGSPVVFVSKAPDGTLSETATDIPARQGPQEQKIAIDKTETSAVNADMGAAAIVTPKKAFDPASLQLRLN